MVSIISNTTKSLFKRLHSFATPRNGHVFQPATFLTPIRLAQWVHCSSEVLKQHFPKHMHRPQVYEVLGEPDGVSTHPYATIWCYQIVEYWLPHSTLCAAPPILSRHDLLFTFDAQGRLQDMERLSR